MNDNARQREAVMRGQYSSSDIAKLQALHQNRYVAPALARPFALPPQLSQQQAAWLPDGHMISNATRRTSVTDRQSDTPRQYDKHGVEIPPSRPSNGIINGNAGNRMNGRMNGNGNNSPHSSPALPNALLFRGDPRTSSRGAKISSMHGNINGIGSPHSSPALPNAMLFNGERRPLSRGADTSSIQGNTNGNLSRNMNGNGSQHSSPALPNSMLFNEDPRALSRGANTIPDQPPTLQNFHRSQNPLQGSNGQQFFGIRQVPNMIPVQANRPRAPPAQMVPPSTNGAQISRPPPTNGVQQPPRLPSASGQRRFDGNPGACG